MNVYPKRDLEAQESLLESVEQVLREKAQGERASEVRHGLVARMANATPPVNEAFRRTLRARVLAEGTKNGRPAMTPRNPAQPVNLWRFALVTLVAVAVVTLVFTFGRTQTMEWGDLPIGHPGSGQPLTTEDFDALAQAINDAPAPRTVLTYPGGASPLAERVQYKTVPLVLGKDASSAAIRDAVHDVLPATGFVDFVIAAGQESDTARQVRATMERALYRLYDPSGEADVGVYGALERNTFYAGPADPALEPIGAVFEGGVELVAGGVLDDPQPGTPLRLAFDWRVQEPVSDSLVMFVHLQRGEFELVAQRDAVPGNGLFPVEGWRPGELVRDQFALLLPPELPVGEYELRVGLYDATTQMRYSLIEPGEGTYVVVQDWVLASPTPEERS